MKIYLAAPYAMRTMLRDEIKPLLERHGHEVTSKWLHQDDPSFDGIQSAVDAHEVPREMVPIVRACCQQDLDDIDRADAIVRFSPGGLNTLIEWGYAIGKGKIAILMGTPDLMFDYAVGHQVIGVAQLLECLVWQEEKVNLGKTRAQIEGMAPATRGEKRTLTFVEGYVSCLNCGCNYAANELKKRVPTFCQTFSYHINPDDAPLNRDRATKCPFWEPVGVLRMALIMPEHERWYEKDSMG